MSPTVHEAFRMVSDLDRSVEFYETLDLEVMERTSRRAEFDTGGCTLTLEEDYDAEALAEYGLPEPDGRRGVGSILVLRVDSVEDVFDRARDAGATVLRQPAEEDWGEKLCLIEDPDGYVVELVRPL